MLVGPVNEETPVVYLAQVMAGGRRGPTPPPPSMRRKTSVQGSCNEQVCARECCRTAHDLRAFLENQARVPPIFLSSSKEFGSSEDGVGLELSGCEMNGCVCVHAHTKKKSRSSCFLQYAV